MLLMVQTTVASKKDKTKRRMQIIIPTASKFEQIIGRQKRADGERYRLMTYVVQQPVGDRLLLFNTLTCSLLLLSPEEAADITAQRELIDHWFLVPQDHDDRKLCRQVRQMAALLKPAAKAIDGYMILTTTGCNARCFYCFEKGTKPVTMTAEAASKVVRYIVAHRGNEKVHIHWFGGEPLVNAKVIDQICTELSEKNIPFYSKLTSNGYLFDADMVQCAKDLWQLQQVHITLDGTEQTYNRVKAYVYRGMNAFERVLENIGLLTAAGIHVDISLNVDQYNIEEMPQLVSLLRQRFGSNEHLSVYSHALYGERSPKNNGAHPERDGCRHPACPAGRSRHPRHRQPTVGGIRRDTPGGRSRGEQLYRHAEGERHCIEITTRYYKQQSIARLKLLA